MIKVVKYRLYPNNKQKNLISQNIGACRWVYNWGLNLRISYYQIDKKSVSIYEIINKLPFLKKQPETKWLNDVDSQALQQSLLRLDKAYTKFFRDKKGFPKFHSKHNSSQSYTHPHPVKIHENTNRIQLPCIGKVKFKKHREIEGKIKQSVISKSPTGKYFISVFFETNEEIPSKPKVNPERTIGIDTGIKTFLVCSDGQTFENPHYLRNSLTKLKVLQRRVSRKVKGSNNRKKAVKRLAKVHETIKNQRLDYIHKVTHRLTNDSQVDTFCIEDLNLKGMVQNHCLAQSLSDVGIGLFYTILEYKADWRGKNIIKIGQWEASSKTCNKCGHINNELTLKDREWTCVKCGTKHDRDRNAADNIKDMGLHPKNNKTGEGSPGGPVEMSALAESMKQEYCMDKPIKR